MEKIQDIDNIKDYLLKLENVGFQSSQLAKAKALLKQMFEDSSALKMLSFTGNIIATGVRGLIIKLIQKGYVDIIITTGATIDHDVMRSFHDYYLGEFKANDKKLRGMGINRLGNIFIPSSAYELLEKITMELFRNGGKFSPSEIARIYGEYLYRNNKHSILSACYERNIPIISPGIIDAAIGLYFYYLSKQTAIEIDPIKDLKIYLDKILLANKTGALIIGGGISKHHTIGANIIRGGLDYAIYITTANEWDGSLSGARSDEAVSWGKIKGNHIDVYGEATYLLPILLEGLI